MAKTQEITSDSFAWLTPMRCRLILGLFLLVGFLANLHFVHNGPYDLSGDEAQYWDWSRKLDLSYYSKGPLVAYIIRASCSIFGETAQAVRYPALVLGVGTSLCTYWLTRKLFGSDRMALGAVLLCAIVPMFMAGSVLMTIDPPFYFCWALATCFAATAVFDEAGWAWPLAGIVIGIGFLAKYAALLWLPAVGLFMLIDPASRAHLRRPGFWLGVMLALACTIPVIVWNVQHDWVSLKHVGTQTGAMGDNRFDPLNIFNFFAGQAGVLNPALFLCLLAAVVHGVRVGLLPLPACREREKSAVRFLLVIGLFFFLITLLSAIRAKPQPNWPAPAYFTLLILTTWFLWQTWPRCRRVVQIAIVIGVLAGIVVRDSSRLIAFIEHVNKWRWVAWRKTGQFNFNPRRVDFAYKLKGNEELGRHVGSLLNPGDFVLCEDYQQTALCAFYVPGQPRTYYAGSWIGRKRLTQYDIWPDRRLDRSELIGKDAIYVGYPSDALKRSFARWEKLPELRIERGGVALRFIPIYRGTGFQGLSRPAGTPEF